MIKSTDSKSICNLANAPSLDALYHLVQTLAQHNEHGKWQQSYIWGNGLLAMNTGANAEQLLTDGRGSITEAISATNTTTYRYDAFGNVDRAGTSSNPFTYNQERFDFGAELQYLRARYVDLELSRFISRDSVLGTPEDPRTHNLYLYVQNDPLSHIDPSGNIARSILNSRLATSRIRNCSACRNGTVFFRINFGRSTCRLCSRSLRRVPPIACANCNNGRRLVPGRRCGVCFRARVARPTPAPRPVVVPNPLPGGGGGGSGGNTSTPGGGNSNTENRVMNAEARDRSKRSSDVPTSSHAAATQGSWTFRVPNSGSTSLSRFEFFGNINWRDHIFWTAAGTAVDGLYLAGRLGSTVKFLNKAGVAYTAADILRPAGNAVSITAVVDRLASGAARWRVSTSNLNIPWYVKRVDMPLEITVRWSTATVGAPAGSHFSSATVSAATGRIPYGWGNNTPTNEGRVDQLRFEFALRSAGGRHNDHFASNRVFSSITVNAP